jgi:membrane protein
MIKPAARDKWELAKETVELWLSKNAFQLAGALAFYTLFSLAPLLIIVITVTGIFLGEEAARGEIAAQIEEYIGSSAAVSVEEAVQRSRIQEAGILPTLLGVGALLFGATTVFAQMQSALNQIWGVVAKPSRSGILSFVMSRLLSLGLVLIIGFLLLVSFALTMVLATFLQVAEEWIPVPGGVASATDLVVSLLVATALFATIFKVLPDVRLAWRDMWRGAFLTAVLFSVGQYLISLYLTRTAPGSTYGAAGSLVLVLMWVYYSSLIIFLGAAYTRVRVRRSGRIIEPKKSAVKVKTEILEGEDEKRFERVAVRD